MSAFAITIHYSGLRAKYFQMNQQRSAGFTRAFLRDDLKALRMPWPRLVYLLNWDEARVMCRWGTTADMDGDVESPFVAAIQKRYEAICGDTALLAAYDISHIEIVPASPLPESLIPGIPDPVTFRRKRRVPAPEVEGEGAAMEGPEAKKARLGLEPPPLAVKKEAAGAVPGSDSQTNAGPRVPLDPVANLDVGESPAGAAVSLTAPGQLSVKPEPQHEFIPPNLGSPEAESKVKIGGDHIPQRSLQDEAQALLREIFETYDRGVQLLADRKLLQQEVNIRQRQVECFGKDNISLRNDLIRRWKAT